jgi:hypothetical protein
MQHADYHIFFPTNLQLKPSTSINNTTIVHLEIHIFNMCYILYKTGAVGGEQGTLKQKILFE